jgi:release factor glutamine methyltransferase
MQALYTQYKQQLTPYYTAHEASLMFRACVAQVLQVDEQKTYFLSDLTATPQQHELLLNMLQQLVHHTPLQYVLGYETFMNLRFAVSPSVLIPRPETAQLVKQIIEENKHRSSLRILDVGTGSGCIAISLAYYLPNAQVTAVDVSKDALAIAQKNAHSIGVNVQFKHLDFLKDAASLLPEFDILVSNPPYVLESEKIDIEEHVLQHEPHLALFVPNQTPLLFYQAIANYACQNIPLVYLEINQALAKETNQLFESYGYTSLVEKDQFGNFRFVRASTQKH